KPAKNAIVRRAITSALFRLRRSWLRAKVDLRRDLRARSGGEVGALIEAHDARKEHGGHALDRGIVILHDGVELAAFDGNAVLGSLELRLQFGEILRGS